MHEQIDGRGLADGLVEAEPSLMEDVYFGAAAALAWTCFWQRTSWISGDTAPVPLPATAGSPPRAKTFTCCLKIWNSGEPPLPAEPHAECRTSKSADCRRPHGTSSPNGSGWPTITSPNRGDSCWNCR
ncbi:hypothetical protein [Paenarthrobacter sp. Z7-10]|uniref:hypothetical protein n=1 Tax=Paenarthrobacter sp. Z7-10 TaxID=2787635 RepID=UPI003FA794B4